MGNYKVQKSIVKALNWYKKQEVVRKKPFLENDSSILSQQLSETEPNTKLFLLRPEFNRSSKQNVYYNDLFKRYNFFQFQNNC